MPTDPTPDLADRLLDSQERQHQERMAEARELRTTIGGRLDRIEDGQKQLGQQLATIQAGGLGSWERRGLLIGGLVVLLLLILLLAESRGVDTSQAVHGVRELAPLASPASASTPPATSTTPSDVLDPAIAD